MPISAEIDHEKKLVRVVLEGRIALDELFDKLDELLKQDIMPYGKLFDARAAQLAFSDADVMALAARTRAYAALAPRGPVALVTARRDTTNILWRFMNLSPGERPLAMFERVRDAVEWLDAKPKA